LTPCCGLELEKPTKAFKSVKGPSNTFDISYNCERTLPSVANLSWDIHRIPQKNPYIKVDISHLAVGLRCRNPIRNLKARTMPGEKEVCRPLTIFHGIFKGSPANKKTQISKLISDILLMA
jgi:hypothetical protein